MLKLLPASLRQRRFCSITLMASFVLPVSFYLCRSFASLPHSSHFRVRGCMCMRACMFAMCLPSPCDLPRWHGNEHHVTQLLCSEPVTLRVPLSYQWTSCDQVTLITWPTYSVRRLYLAGIFAISPVCASSAEMLQQSDGRLSLFRYSSLMWMSIDLTRLNWSSLSWCWMLILLLLIWRCWSVTADAVGISLSEFWSLSSAYWVLYTWGLSAFCGTSG